MARVVFLLCLLFGCGIEVVELAPADDALVIGDVPADAIARLRSGGDAMMDPKMLSLRYPEERTALPANIAPIRFDWEPGGKADAFEVSFTTPSHTLRVYTVETNVTLPVAQWNALLRDDSLQVELRAADKMIKRGEPRMLLIRPAVEGTLYVDGSSAALSDLTLSVADADIATGAVSATGRVARVGRSRIELDGSSLLAPEGSRIAEPSWSADGRTIVFSYWPPELALADDPSDEHDGSQLARFVDGVFSLIPLDGEKMNPRRPRYSFDGRWLAFDSQNGIAVAPAEGGMARRLMCDGMMMGPMMKQTDRAPAWLPGVDGRAWLAFVSTRTYLEPHAQIWLRELDSDLQCSPPFWFPAQDVGAEYQRVAFTH